MKMRKQITQKHVLAMMIRRHGTRTFKHFLHQNSRLSILNPCREQKKMPSNVQSTPTDIWFPNLSDTASVTFDFAIRTIGSCSEKVLPCIAALKAVKRNRYPENVGKKNKPMRVVFTLLANKNGDQHRTNAETIKEKMQGDNLTAVFSILP